MISCDISAALNNGRGFFQSPWCYFHLFTAINSNSTVPTRPGKVMFRLTPTTSIIPPVPSFALSPIHSLSQLLISRGYIYFPLRLPLDAVPKKAWSHWSNLCSGAGAYAVDVCSPLASVLPAVPLPQAHWGRSCICALHFHAAAKTEGSGSLLWFLQCKQIITL